MMHERLIEMRERYGDSDENDQHYLNEYLKVVKTKPLLIFDLKWFTKQLNSSLRHLGAGYVKMPNPMS
jgi:hypothetical protein